jgi:hypothetical protein
LRARGEADLLSAALLLEEIVALDLSPILPHFPEVEQELEESA